VKTQLLVLLQIAYTCTMHERKMVERYTFAWLTCFRGCYEEVFLPTIKLEATLTHTLQSALQNI
jgi:hypothetical protein